MTRISTLAALIALLVTVLVPPPLSAAGAEANSVTETPTLFYFHGKVRCSTCRSIEEAAETVVRETYSEAFEKGDLAWRVVDFEKPENAHYIKELGLPGSSLVLARVSSSGAVSDAKILHKVWRLSRDPKAMRAYIAEEIATFAE